MENTCIIITIALYLLGMIYIGIRNSRQSSGSVNEFYLGGRQLGPFVTAMSAEASDMSSWLLMGLPGVALSIGIADAAWTAIGLGVGTYLNWLIVARPIRRYSERLDAHTIPDFFSNRFRDKSGLLAAISAIVIIVFFVPYTGSGFAAIGKLFETLFGVDYHIAMLVGAAVIILYTVIGGFLAVSTTDFVQSIVMSIALIVVLFFGISSAGGWDNAISNAAELPGYLSMTATYDAAAGAANDYGPLTIVSTMAWGLGYFGMPHILLRFMAIKDENKLKLSRRIGTIWVIISMAIAIIIGVIGYSVVQVNGIELADSERIIVEIAKLLSHNGIIAALVAGLIIAGILASTMSTADSQLLAASSSVSENIVRRFFAKGMSTKGSMTIARITVILIAIVAAIFAWDPNSSVFGIVSFAWAGFGAAFGPLVLFALFWERTNKVGAVAGMVAGGVGVIVWEYVITPMGAASGNGMLTIYELLPAFILSSIVLVVVSLATKAPDKAIIDEFRSIRAELKGSPTIK